jgi:class 3 adenylate cyclase
MADTSGPDQNPRPAQAGPPDQRVSDADRDRTVTMLREHVGAGRLTLDEFSDRMGRALQATTRGDLDAVMVDLPSETIPLPEQSVTPRKARRWHIAVLSGHQTKGRWRIGGKTTAVAVMGGCDLDLRRAEIEGPEIEITAVAFWGGVQIIVPEGFDVELRGFSFMGGRSLRTRDVPIVPGSPRIVVKGFAVMGGVDVKSRSRSRSSRSRREFGASVADAALGMAADAIESAGTRPGTENYDLSEIGREIRRQFKVDSRAVRHDARRDARAARRSQPPWPPATPARPGTASGSPARSSPPASSSREPAEPILTDGTVTILFCDMVDYAGMTERVGDHVSRRLLLDEHHIVRDALARHSGREIKVQGDGFMLAFPGVARALRCAIEIQRGTVAYVPPPGGEPISVHIGVHTGDAVVEDDDYLGLTVIVASRLADAAGPGEILVSSLSEQLVAGSGEFMFMGHQETQLKGMARAQLSAALSWA